LVLPQLSGDYKLIHLFIPLFLFFNAQKSSRLDWLYALMFGLLLIPKDYYWFGKVISDNGTHDISISMIINIIILVGMFLLIMGTGLEKWYKNEWRSRLQSRSASH
jgi:hypothetical protein